LATDTGNHTGSSDLSAWACISQQQRLDGLEVRCQAYEEQIALLKTQVAEIEQLKAEMAELREQVKRNSRNSSKPPSSDPPYLRRSNKNKASGRKQGGQKGHRGISRNLKPEEEVSRIIDVRPIGCSECGCLLLGDDPHPERHQVSEVPKGGAGNGVSATPDQMPDLRNHQSSGLAR